MATPKEPTFTVTRMCCVSGRCDKCMRKPKRIRVVHITGVSEKSADRHCAGWAAFAPKKVQDK